MLLLACHSIREIICAAALASQYPLRISFASALDVVRGPVDYPGLHLCATARCGSAERITS